MDVGFVLAAIPVAVPGDLAPPRRATGSGPSSAGRRFPCRAAPPTAARTAAWCVAPILLGVGRHRVRRRRRRLRCPLRRLATAEQVTAEDALALDVQPDAERQLEAFSRELFGSTERQDPATLPTGVQRAMREAKKDARRLEKFLRWRSRHPERAKDFEKADASTAQRQSQFEDDGTVNSLLVAFMRDVRIRAQSLEREVPAGMRSKVVHIMRHGQGFHNMLEDQKGMEAVVTPASFARQEDEGHVWTVAPVFDGEFFTEAMGPRGVVGVEVPGLREFVVAYSGDEGATWTELPPFAAEGSRDPCRVIFEKSVKCTHMRLRPRDPAAGPVKSFSPLAPVGARSELLDPALTARGRAEAAAAHKDALLGGLSPQLVVVSPVTRATETACIAFKHLFDANGQPRKGVRFVAHEGLHERGGVNRWDCRRQLTELKAAFPHIDYSGVESESDPFWSSQRESQASMITRLYSFLLWLRDCPEKEVALASHCGILFTMLNAVVDCALDPDLSNWFCTAEIRSLRLLWEGPAKEEAKFVDGASHIRGLSAGACCLYPHLVQLGPQEREEDTILLRRDFREHAESSRVAIVCGGGAGHEPLGGGFVGRGLLTASVTGALFAGPSPGAVLKAIRATASEAGCLLLVKNYPGLRFNHAIAADRARGLGIKVEIVVVADDVGSVTAQNADGEKLARGLVGTILALKAAGACAEGGGTLEEVAAAARGVAERTRTMAMALQWRGADWDLEFGVGIHGEHGAWKLPSLMHLPGAKVSGAATAVARALLGKLLPALDLPAEDRRVLVALNNLGGTSPLEMTVLCNAVCQLLTDAGAQPVALVHGTLMTSLDTHGVSLSLVSLGGDPADGGGLLGLMREPAQPNSAWPGVVDLDMDAPRVVANPVATQEPKLALATEHGAVDPGASLEGRAMRAAVKAACDVLVDKATVTALNAMDRASGDGDCGTTYRDAGLAVLERLHLLPDTARPHQVLHFLATELEDFCRGALGGVYVLGLEAAASKLRKQERVDAAVWAAAAAAAERSIARKGGAQRGDRTVLDALGPAADALARHAAEGDREALKAAVAAAKKGAKETQHMVADKRGRARHSPAWVQQRFADPGAVGFAKWLEAVYKSLRRGIWESSEQSQA